MHRVWRWGAVSLILLLAAGVPLGRPVPAKAAAEQLTIGHSTWVGYGPLYIARDKRFYDEEGVAVELQKIEDPKLRFAALAAGRLDGIVTTLDTMSLYWKRNFQFRAVLGIDDSKGGDGIIALGSIKSIKDLRGRTVAFNEGSVSHFFLSVLLRQNGMTEKDIKGVNMVQDQAAAAFLSHKVDAAVTWEPWLTKASKTPGDHILVDSSSTPGLIVDVMLLRRDVITAHPKAIEAAVKAWYRAVDYWKKNPDESDALMAKEVGGWLKDVKTFRETLAGVRFYDEAINKQYFAPGGQMYVTADNAITIWKSFGKITEPVEAADLIDPEFVR
jgi:NitT/TauT family transport system substrate-binding protein